MQNRMRGPIPDKQTGTKKYVRRKKVRNKAIFVSVERKAYEHLKRGAK
jgi:hypothetical protein